MKRLLGYGIMRTWSADIVGKTFSAYPHELYPSREAAEAALERLYANGQQDYSYAYSVAEVWMVG